MPDSAEIFRKLRGKIFSLTPADINVAPLASGVWGALMEFSAGQTWVTLVSMLDGSTSLYFGSGGGVIGAGQNDAVRKANLLFLQVAGQSLNSLRKTESYPTPQPGCVHFYVLRPDGVYASDEFEESALRTPGHAMLPLYAAAQNVITQIRLVQEKQQAT